MLVLVTGATGKVGQAFLARFLADRRWPDARLRALCHKRRLEPQERVEIIHGSLADQATVEAALDGVTHVFHLATVKEDPQTAMDVSVKGLFWLLEAFRASPTAAQFVLIGGDCVVGHVFVPYGEPITELAPRRSYPGVYALSKVLEEAMLEQYYVQYDIDGCCLRAPWIMEKDDFRHVLSFEDQFGGPSWESLLPAETRVGLRDEIHVPLLIDRAGQPLKRNFVHVSDLVEAMLAVIDNPAARQQLFNIAMDRPVDYGLAAEHLGRTRGLEPVRIETGLHSNWLDNSKARHLLGWEPRYDLNQLIEDAYAYRRSESDPRRIWYPG